MNDIIWSREAINNLRPGTEYFWSGINFSDIKLIKGTLPTEQEWLAEMNRIKALPPKETSEQKLAKLLTEFDKVKIDVENLKKK